MSMTDPIADFCTRIRNGYAAKKRWVDVPSSTLKKRLSLVLKEEGYIDNFVFVEKEDSKEDIRLYLRYNENAPAITTIEKISKPGKRKRRKGAQWSYGKTETFFSVRPTTKIECPAKF